MKNLWDKVKGLVVEDDAPVAEIAPAPVATPAPKPQPISNLPVATADVGDVPSVLDVANVEAQLISVIESDPGFLAYKTFDDSANTLAEIITDESTRFKAAAKTTKLTGPELTASLQTFQTVLATEQDNFNSQFVIANEQAIAQLQAEEQVLESQIVEAAQKLSEMSERKNKLTQDIVLRGAELGKAKIDFNSVVQTVTNRYTGLLNKLTKYLGA